MTENVMDNMSTDANLNQETTAQQQERLFKQSELNEIVGRAKHEAVESYKRQHTQNQAQQSTQQQSFNSPRSLSEDDVKRLTSEELARQRDQWAREAEEKQQAEQAQRIVKNFWDKIAPGKEKYQDFDSVAGNIDFQYYPNVVQLLAEQVDNADDVLYELGKNRLKLAQLESASYINPKDAIYEVKRLSDSIKANNTASNTRVPNAPISQQRPSNLGTDSGSTLSMADLKRKYRG